jgi:4-amino-4-deoxy-L-arabinose transferase-like glycosyltransferase
MFDRLAKAAEKSPWIDAALPYGFLLLCTVPLVVSQSLQQSLMAHDEGFYATQARYILETGDWITPQWGFEIKFDRTIGIQWLIALCYKLFGMHETSVRLPSAIAYIFSSFLTFRMGELLLGRAIGFLAALIFSVTPIMVQYAWLGTQDSCLVAIELLAVWAFLESQKSQQTSLLFLTGAAFGWGFLIKGFMVIPAAIALVPALFFPAKAFFQFKANFSKNLWLLLGIIVGLLPVVGWLYAATQEYGWMPIQTLVGKMFLLNNQEFHSAGPLYYFWNIPANAFPWAIPGSIGLVLAGLNPRYRETIAPYRWLVFGFPLILFLELNLFKTKTPYYSLQLLPWIAIFSAITLDHCVAHYRKDWRSQLMGQISSVLAAFATVLLMLSVGVLLNWIPIQADNIRSIAFVLATLAIGWLIPGVIWKRRADVSRTELITRWLSSLILGPWLALTLVGVTGLWGNYAAPLTRTFQNPALQSILTTQPIHFIGPKMLSESEIQKTYLLLTWKTPILGRHFTNLDELPPKSYAWIAPDIQIPKTDRKIITTESWRLIQRP